MAVSHVKTSPTVDWTGTVTLFNSQGSSVTANATDLMRPSDWNSAHNQFYTLTGNTLGNSTASGTDVVFAASGPSISIAGSTNSLIISSPPHVSMYQNIPLFGASTSASLNGASVSHCVSFNVVEPISASFIRIPASFTTQSTTLATTAATLVASVERYSTWNAVVYSMGTGANSKSLQSVASGSCGATMRNSISVAVNGTQYSVTQGWTMPMEGGSTGRTTQYSISNTNLSFTTNQIATEISGLRYIDIPFANTLSGGPFWLIFGLSTNSATNSTGVSAASGVGASYTFHHVVSQFNIAVGVMGSASSVVLGAGSFSTAGGGTTNSVPFSAISSSASNNMPMFQLIRSA